MSFRVLDHSIALIRSLRGVVGTLRTHDPALARQARNAASSVALNLAEGRARSGRDRRYHFQVALGSASELRTALLVAEAWGDLDPARNAPVQAQLDEIIAMLWRLTH